VKAKASSRTSRVRGLIEAACGPASLEATAPPSRG
jgi:hypothetical protein